MNAPEPDRATRQVELEIHQHLATAIVTLAALLVAHADARQRDGRLDVVIPPEANAVRRVAQLTRLADTAPGHTTRAAFAAHSEARAG